MVNWNKMATIIIALVVLFLIALWQFGPEGLFGGIKKAVDKVSGVVKIGAEEVEATTPTIPAEHEAAIKKLVDTMQKMINSDKKKLFP